MKVDLAIDLPVDSAATVVVIAEAGHSHLWKGWQYNFMLRKPLTLAIEII